MPSARKQLRVDAQSCAVEKFEISDLPRESAAMSAARWEIDLSPGNRSRPFIELAGFSFMQSVNVRDATLESKCAIKHSILLAVSSPSAGVPPEKIKVFKEVRGFVPSYEAVSTVLYPTVLVAEDSVDTRIMLKRAFELKGYGVLEAEDGQQALELARRYRPSLIVIDLNMPVLDGLETIRNYRRIEGEGNQTPIIAITAYDVYGMEKAALETGCNIYLSKPLNLEELDRAVKSLGFLV